MKLFVLQIVKLSKINSQTSVATEVDRNLSNLKIGNLPKIVISFSDLSLPVFPSISSSEKVKKS